TVAGQICQRGADGRPFIESMDRHDWEQLIDSPDIRRRLKDAEVAVIYSVQCSIQILKLFRNELDAAQGVVNFFAAVPVKAFGLRSFSEAHIAVAKQALGFLLRLARIMKALLYVLGHDALVSLVELME